MKTTTLLLVAALAFTSVVAVAPTASACPHEDYPCTPPPYDPLACPGYPKITQDPVGWVLCEL